MKILFIKPFLLLLFISFITSCSSDDDKIIKTEGKNNITIEFDNGVEENDLLLGVSTYTNSNDESLKINRLNYIVSNFVLIDEKGNEYIYPKDKSYFVISEESKKTSVELLNIPAGNYVSIKFGVGVDQEKYQEGAEGQDDLFLQTAEENNMMWSWQAGYKFLNFEGTFTAPTITEATDFKIHMGSHGTSLDNYKEVELSLPTQALVNNDLSPVIHLAVDANNILDGEYKIKLSEKAVVMIDEVKSPQIASNTSKMFRVDHVHNGKNIAH